MELSEVVSLIIHQEIEKESYLRFMIAFGRLDYAIKREQTFINGNRINWNGFSNALTEEFYEKDCVDLIETVFFKDPPRPWSLSDQSFSKKQGPIKDTYGIVKSLCDLRNNFFHGSKGKLNTRDNVLVIDGYSVLERLYNRTRTSEGSLRKIGLWIQDVEGTYDGK